MRKFLLRCSILVSVVSLICVFIIHYDTYNIFHWNNIRFTSAEPNKNFVKTKYIIRNPNKFNAYILGSSRIGNIPPALLPSQKDGKKLHWYNMTYSEGLPSEHLLTLETFLKNGVSIDMVILGFDDIAMYSSIEEHYNQLLRMPYQVFENNEIAFLKPYFMSLPAVSIIKEVTTYDPSEHKADHNSFYDFGVYQNNLSYNLGMEAQSFPSAHQGVTYTQIDSYKDIENIYKLCKEKNIHLILLTNPIYVTTYIDSIQDGYLDFLRKVAQNCEFYNFSTLNNYCQDSRYYFEGSHYRPALGLIVEKVLFGTEDEQNEIRKEAGDELFGVKVNSENIDFIISELEKQLQKYKKELRLN